ncbi:hypothetical protein [Demequina litorisediminis]|uniref:Uncharacterized protein n=1 Tax=Demequina litorisediminis TaxID=1849022 RepID=A0ABQ6IDF6_9MICO|nr:hypothetical protein [Demequina litorisediminis]GMA34773.1 hypothetical protein GCM10025876_09770 [Demequina litorisediminis]
MNARASKDSAAVKAPMSNKKFLTIWIPVVAFITILLIVANMALVIAGGWVASQFGSGTYTFTNSEESEGWDTDYYESEYSDIDERRRRARPRLGDRRRRHRPGEERGRCSPARLVLAGDHAGPRRG